MSAIQQILLAGGAPAENRVFSYIANDASISNQTTYTFSAKSVGAEAGDRYIVVCVHLLTNVGGISSVSVGGYPATEVVVEDSTDARTGIYYIYLPNGTTANIVVNTASGGYACAIGIYRLTGYNSLAVRMVAKGYDSYSGSSYGTLLAGAYLTGLQPGDTCIFAASLNRNDSPTLDSGTPNYANANTELGYAATSFVTYANDEYKTFTNSVSLSTNMSVAAVAFH